MGRGAALLVPLHFPCSGQFVSASCIVKGASLKGASLRLSGQVYMSTYGNVVMCYRDVVIM